VFRSKAQEVIGFIEKEEEYEESPSYLYPRASLV